MTTMPFTTPLRAIALLASIAAVSAQAAPGGGDVTVKPPVAGGFVIKNNAGSADRMRVTEGGEVYLPNLPHTSDAGNVLCYENSGRLGKCAPSALPSGGSLPWARSNATAPNGIAIPILVINTPSSVGVSVTTDHAGNYVANWMASLQPPLAMVSITCGVYVNGDLVPGSQTQEVFNQTILAPRTIQGSALVPAVPAGSMVMPRCMSNLLGVVAVAGRIVLQEVGDAQLSTIP